MDKKLKAILERLDDSDLSRWSDSRSISRGRGYVSRVHDIVAVENGGVTAKVDGTHEYLATIYLDNAGKVKMECSCPVGHGCKHCVALALRCRDALTEKKKLKTLARDNPYWRDLKYEFGDGMGFFGKSEPVYTDEADAFERIEAMDAKQLKELVYDLIKNVDEALPYLSRKFTMESASSEKIVQSVKETIKLATQNPYNYWEHHGRHGYYDDDGWEDTPDYSFVKESFEQLAKLGNVQELMKLCDYFAKRCSEQLEASDDEGYMLEEMQGCVEVVARAVFGSDLPDSEKLLWEYRRKINDGFPFLANDHDKTLTFWERKDISKKEWSNVADEIVKDCKKRSAEHDHGPYGCWQYLSTALNSAGRGDEAVDIAIATCDSPDGYRRVIEALYARNRVDEAAEWCRKALSDAKSDDWHFDAFRDWLRRFAAERGDWRVAAAYDVARFIRHPVCEEFFSLEEPCRKAGVWEKARKILLQCLETGAQPLKRKGWPLPVPEYGEAVLSAKECPMAETLCRIALREKRGPDMVRWLDELVGLKSGYGLMHQAWMFQELCFSVASAIEKEMPDEALRIWKRIIAANCQATGEHYYETIVRALKAMKPTMDRQSGEGAWRAMISRLRNEYSRRRNFVKLLDGLK